MAVQTLFFLFVTFSTSPSWRLLAQADYSASTLNRTTRKALTLRQFYSGRHLRFDSTGKPDPAGSIGPWTVDGQMRVQEISLKSGVIHIRAQRLFLFYDPASKRLRDVNTLTKQDPESKRFDKKIAKWAAAAGKTEIDIECGQPDPEMADIKRAMDAVFLASDEPLTSVVPIFWKGWLEPKDVSDGVSSKDVVNADHPDEKPVKVGGHVSAPHVNYDPDPGYSEAARAAKYQSNLTLWLVVDREGRPTHIRVSRPAGMGLDEKAVAAVQQWTFDPAKKDGEPVSVMIRVEVNFRLY